MRELLIIGIGGFIGAVLRYIISGIIPVKFGIPTGTLIVNLIGSFIIGFIMYSSLTLNIPPEYRLLIVTGFCGALTTFSTFSYESFSLLENGFIVKFTINILLNVFGCIGMVYLGRIVSLMLFR
ncbi:fluoride efflux transporter CrcB [Methanothermococcus okinawensis]|uniref:Fluoride-specific ion channel FluC n=1 Tax=Methanothermococcus okinawensis (strain DSM 14208 / JCM 11175 / IH1) TaxID=647113 RepID=F8AKE7_METOI|nr:fluoride efflux transporter CrcB [Methanothermococcus okinawensis]AEH06347.1 CrcB-like protein [Methanothermococcus okinawensis IH1]